MVLYRITTKGGYMATVEKIKQYIADYKQEYGDFETGLINHIKSEVPHGQEFLITHHYCPVKPLALAVHG